MLPAGIDAKQADNRETWNGVMDGERSFRLGNMQWPRNGEAHGKPLTRFMDGMVKLIVSKAELVLEGEAKSADIRGLKP